MSKMVCIGREVLCGVAYVGGGALVPSFRSVIMSMSFTMLVAILLRNRENAAVIGM